MASKKIYSALAVVGLVAVSVAAWWFQNKSTTATEVAAGQGPKTGAGAPGAAPSGLAGGGPRAVGVEVAQVAKADIRDDAQTVGNLRSRQNVMLRPEVAGRVSSIGFVDGNQVRAGQMLVQLDDTLQRAEVQQGLAQVSIAQANFKRNQDLVEQNFVAKRVLDESEANLQVAQAQLALSCARLQRMRITAPFSGTVGIRNINIGDYVKDGADLINLEDISTLYVDFRLPERFQAKLRLGQEVEVQLDALTNRLYRARVEAIDPLIDANGRSIGVRALLRNDGGEPLVTGKAGAGLAGIAPQKAVPPQGLGVKNSASSAPLAQSQRSTGSTPVRDQMGVDKPNIELSKCPPSSMNPPMASGPATNQSGGPLRPGMFARVTAVFAMRENTLYVPEESIVPQGGRQFVIKVVSADTVTDKSTLPPDTATVSQRTEVKLGIRSPGRVEITDGLAEGDTVVIAGQQRLQKDGTALRLVQMGKAPEGQKSAGDKPAGDRPAGTPANASALNPATGAAPAAKP